MQELNYPINWDSKQELGIAEIDVQHKQYVSNLNGLYLAWLEAKPLNEINALLKAFIDYEDFHFKYEEELIAKNNFSDLEKHKKIHAAYSKKLLKMVATYQESGNNADLFLILGYLEDWLISHVRKYDRKYVPFIK